MLIIIDLSQTFFKNVKHSKKQIRVKIYRLRA
jgi:hypothetical protein